MMRELLRKDWRVNRAAVVGGAALVACPYAVLLSLQAMYPPPGGNTLRTYGSVLEQSATAGVLLTLVMAAVFGGTAFASERRDRSAEFLAMLPVSRGRIVLSKLLVAVPSLVLIGLVHACAGMIGTAWRVRADLPPSSQAHGVIVFTAVAVLFFGLAWMLSAYLRSPAVAASVAIGAATLLYFVTIVWMDEHLRERAARLGQQVSPWYALTLIAATSFGVGALAFVGATAHYLRRVRP